MAHNRQKDKLKRPYREHVIAVGDALADFDDDIRIAGYLHDIAEDTPMTRQALLDMGVSERAVDIIERVTKRLHENPDDYQAGIRYIAEDHDATLVKIADNAHNSLPERVKALAEKWPDKPPVTRYNDARPVLYAAVPVEETRKILARINPWLLEELDDLLDEADDTDYENLSYDDAHGGPDGGRAGEAQRAAEPLPPSPSRTGTDHARLRPHPLRRAGCHGAPGRSEPRPGPGDVRIRVAAAGLNPVDFKLRQGALRPISLFRLPVSPAAKSPERSTPSDPDPSRFAVGDRVYARVDKRRLGAFAELVCVQQELVAAMPASLGSPRPPDCRWPG